MTVTFLSVGIYETRDIDLKGPFPAVDKGENESTGWCPDDSLPVANRKNESDSVLQECREQQRGGIEKIPQAKIRQRGGRQKPRYPSRGRIPSIFTKRQPTTIKRIKILLFLFCFLGVEGSSSQMDFLTSPKNQTIKEGLNLTLECSINSTSPPVNITWVKNDDPIVPGKRRLVSSNSTTSMLTIIAASPSDQGRYYCIATNNNYQQMLQSQVGYVTNEEGGPKKATNDNKGLIIGITVGLLAIFLVVVRLLLPVRLVLPVLKLRSHKKAEDDEEVTTDLNSSD